MKNKAKKSLGQNFLINPKIAERIAKDADISKKDIILEIGPGTGNLTKHLLLYAKKVIAIEKDNALCEILKEKFKKEIKNKKLVLKLGDILNPLCPSDISPLAGGEKYKVVANIPYNITGAIFKKFLTAKNKPESMTLMIQKEVAERIIARNDKENLLSLSVKAYGDPKILFKVSRGNFFPAPNVDSAVIKISNISNKNFLPLLKKERVGVRSFEEKFFEILHAGFVHKRKKLISNLKEKFPQVRHMGNLSENTRAEDLKLEDWFNLSKNILNN